MKTVILTEKPSVAKEIAVYLGCNEKSDGYFKSDKYAVTWAYGHIVILDSAAAYCENPWRIESLPILPDEFSYRISPEKGRKEQFQIIESLFSRADEIINACDAGREGELIFRYIYNYCKNPGRNVKRLWVSSYEKKDLDNAFCSLKDQKHYDSLFFSGMCRSHADWMFGINSTVALSKLLSSTKTLSMGRVQTPTYISVTRRFIDNQNFTPVAYLLPNVTLKKGEYAFSVNLKTEKHLSEAEGKAIIENCGDQLECLESTANTFFEEQPLLPSLSTIQKKAFSVYKFPADMTLSIMQDLYEKYKVITYPRTDSKHITVAKFEKIPELLKKCSVYDDFDQFYELIDFKSLPDKSVDDKKVTDHHAVIPNGNFPEKLPENHKKIFDLILKNFFASFMPPCKKSKQTLTFKSKGGDFFIIEEVSILFDGFRKINPSDRKSVFIPSVDKGESLDIIKKENKQLFTKPPKLFNDSSLLVFMETCGKEFEIEDLPKDVIAKGIGTEATRAGIIKKVIETGYIKREKGNLVPTDLGMQLYDLLKDMNISSVNLTGEWESKLYQIYHNGYSPEEFLKLIKEDYKTNLLPQLLSVGSNSFDFLLSCPKCGNNTLAEKNKLFECIALECDFKLWKTFKNKKLSSSQCHSVLKGDKLFVKGMKNKENKSFDAFVFLDQNYALSVEFKKTGSQETELVCPSCSGKIHVSEKTFFCKSCDFIVFKTISGKTLSDDQLIKLITSGESDVIKGFISMKKKTEFEARLILDENRKPQFKFS